MTYSCYDCNVIVPEPPPLFMPLAMGDGCCHLYALWPKPIMIYYNTDPGRIAHPASDTMKLRRAASKRGVPGEPNSRRKMSYRPPSAVSPRPPRELVLGTTCTTLGPSVQ